MSDNLNEDQLKEEFYLSEMKEHDRLRLKFEHEERLYKEKLSEKRKLYVLAMIFIFAIFTLIFVAILNPNIFKIDPETFVLINQAMNAVVVLMIPFILGGVGGATRVLMSGLSFIEYSSLVVSSGLMSMFSWVSIKSGVFISIIAPHMEKNGLDVKAVSGDSSNFYTMALVAIIVGMFSTNIYLFINQRVEQLTLKNKESS